MTALAVMLCGLLGMLVLGEAAEHVFAAQLDRMVDKLRRSDRMDGANQRKENAA